MFYLNTIKKEWQSIKWKKKKLLDFQNHLFHNTFSSKQVEHSTILTSTIHLDLVHPNFGLRSIKLK
jgi:hypothetical protein